VLLVGFQAQGTLGRILHDGAPRVRIQGEDIDVRARIRTLDCYSGHADAGQLARWIAERGAISGNLFLVHGEEDSLAGLASRVGAGNIIAPRLDDAYDLAGAQARLLDGAAPRRMNPAQMGRLDWHNDVSKLMLDISDELGRAPDEKTRAVIIRRLRRALEGEKN
jgi:metallo-beta-lactamase family protein